MESAEKDDVNAAPVVGALVLRDATWKRMDMTQRNTRGFGGTVGLVMALVVVGDGGTATMTHDLDTPLTRQCGMWDSTGSVGA